MKIFQLLVLVKDIHFFLLQSALFISETSMQNFFLEIIFSFVVNENSMYLIRRLFLCHVNTVTFNVVNEELSSAISTYPSLFSFFILPFLSFLLFSSFLSFPLIFFSFPFYPHFFPSLSPILNYIVYSPSSSLIYSHILLVYILFTLLLSYQYLPISSLLISVSSPLSGILISSHPFPLSSPPLLFNLFPSSSSSLG